MIGPIALVALTLGTGSPVPGGELPPGELPVVRMGPRSLWTRELASALEDGFAALPPKMRSFPGGPLEIEVHDEPSPFGMGDGTSAHPEWTGRRFHLYRYAEPAEPRARFRLEQLPAASRERIWRQRALVHAVLQRWDDARHFSRREDWKRVTGWQSTLERPLITRESPLNNYDWAYSRKRGMESASLDFVTFAEEVLVPAESVDANPLPVDDSVFCQEFSKLRFLDEVLAPFGRAKVSRTCPAFERWSDLSSLSHFEILFAAPSGQHAESIFGHLLLRPVRKEGAMATGPGFEPVLEIAALTGGNEGRLEYLIKGMTGQFQTVFATTTLAQALTQNVEVDQRTLRRFRLMLTASEQARLMERIWELERRGYLSYFFFTDNCARQLIWVLNSVLEGGRKIEVPGTFWVMPVATLDSMARVDIKEPDGTRPLLEYVPGDFVSHEFRALEGDRRREQLVEALAGSIPGVADAWHSLLERMRRPDPSARLEAFQALPALIRTTLDANDSMLTQVRLYGVLRATEAVERFSADGATALEHSLGLRTAKIDESVIHLPTAEELVAERQRQFQREDAAARQQVDLDRITRIGALLNRLPHRPFTAEEQGQYDTAERTARTFVAFTRIEGDALDGPLSGAEVGARAAEVELADAEDRTRAGQSLLGSGYGFLGVAFSPGSLGDTWRPTVSIHSALVLERIGDQRLRGFGPQSEVRLLDTEALWRFDSGPLPAVYRVEETLIGFKTLGRTPVSERHSLRDWLGFGVELEMALRELPLKDQRGTVGGQFYAVLDASPRFERFTAVGLGAAAQAPFEFLPSGLSVGPRAELWHRTPIKGHLANAFRLSAVYMPQWTLLGGTFGSLTHVASGSAQLEYVLGRAFGREVVFGPKLDASLRRGPTGDLRELSFALAAEWM